MNNSFLFASAISFTLFVSFPLLLLHHFLLFSSVLSLLFLFTLSLLILVVLISSLSLWIICSNTFWWMEFWQLTTLPSLYFCFIFLNDGSFFINARIRVFDILCDVCSFLFTSCRKTYRSKRPHRWTAFIVDQVKTNTHTDMHSLFIVPTNRRSYTLQHFL